MTRELIPRSNTNAKLLIFKNMEEMFYKFLKKDREFNNPGWPFLMVLASAPYLAFLFATGAWRHPVAEYPYGFANPERTLFVLAMIGRLLNVGFAVGTAALAYGIADRLVGRAAARWTPTCWPRMPSTAPTTHCR